MGMILTPQDINTKSNDELRRLRAEQQRRMNVTRARQDADGESSREYQDAAMLKHMITAVLRSRGTTALAGIRPRAGGAAIQMGVNGIAPDSEGLLRLNTQQRAFVIRAAGERNLDPMTFVRSLIDQAMKG